MFTVSTFTKGEQMVPVLNKLDVRCAVYGNHDFGKQFINVFRKRSMYVQVEIQYKFSSMPSFRFWHRYADGTRGKD